MPLQPTTKAQVTAHGFIRRRARNAVAAGDPRMLHDPHRRQARSFGVGLTLAVLGVAGAVILSFFRPAGDVDRATVMVGTQSGALYVRMDSTVHPVLNLASARLLLGSAGEPTRVREADIAATERGPLLGIPGAPSVLPDGRGPEEARAFTWTVCDQPGDRSRPGPLGTLVIASDQPLESAPETAPAETGVLVRHGQGTWLLRDGTRSRITEPDGQRALEILGLSGVEPRPVSAALLDTLVEVAPLSAPDIPGAGDPVGYGLDGVRVGQVLLTDPDPAAPRYVALRDGIQQVGPAVADLIHATQPVGPRVHLRSSRLDVPRSTALDVDGLPEHAPRLAPPLGVPVLCARWSAAPAEGSRRSALLFGATLPAADTGAVRVVGADGPGPRVDQVSVPGGGLVVSPVGATTGPDGAASTVLVADTGVAHEIAGTEAADALGISGTPAAVPVGLLARLPLGPPLSVSAAATEHDGLPAGGGGES